MALAVGQMAPDFTLKSQDGRMVRLSDYRGKKNVVLAFFPLAWTPV
jgi:peroxiredoxin